MRDGRREGGGICNRTDILYLVKIEKYVQN